MYLGKLHICNSIKSNHVEQTINSGFKQRCVLIRLYDNDVAQHGRLCQKENGRLLFTHKTHKLVRKKKFEFS